MCKPIVKEYVNRSTIHHEFWTTAEARQATGWSSVLEVRNCWGSDGVRGRSTQPISPISLSLPDALQRLHFTLSYPCASLPPHGRRGSAQWPLPAPDSWPRGLSRVKGGQCQQGQTRTDEFLYVSRAREMGLLGFPFLGAFRRPALWLGVAGHVGQEKGWEVINTYTIFFIWRGWGWIMFFESWDRESGWVWAITQTWPDSKNRNLFFIK